MLTRTLAAFLIVLFLAPAPLSAKPRTKPLRIPWKSRIFLDKHAFQQNFGSVNQLKTYMLTHDKKVFGHAKAGKYTIHFMAFFKKVQPSHIYILIWDVSKRGARDFVQRYDFRGVPERIDRFASAFTIAGALVQPKKKYLFELKAKSAKGAVLLTKTEFQVR